MPKYLVELMKKYQSDSLAKDIVDVQPLSGPTGQVLSMRARHQSIDIVNYDRAMRDVC